MVVKGDVKSKVSASPRGIYLTQLTAQVIANPAKIPWNIVKNLTLIGSFQTYGKNEYPFEMMRKVRMKTWTAPRTNITSEKSNSIVCMIALLMVNIIPDSLARRKPRTCNLWAITLSLIFLYTFISTSVQDNCWDPEKLKAKMKVNDKMYYLYELKTWFFQWINFFCHFLFWTLPCASRHNRYASTQGR